MVDKIYHAVVFQSTPSARRATPPVTLLPTLQRFQSTPSARRATKKPAGSWSGRLISIHALREESDPKAVKASVTMSISIHALREESDLHPAPCRGLR